MIWVGLSEAFISTYSLGHSLCQTHSNDLKTLIHNALRKNPFHTPRGILCTSHEEIPQKMQNESSGDPSCTPLRHLQHSFYDQKENGQKDQP